MSDPATTIASSIDSYGPAMSRRTRTPIQFTSNLPAGQSAEYDPAGFSNISEFLSNPSLIPALLSKGMIRVNPAVSKDVNASIRHESVHGLLSPIEDFARSTAQQLPSFAPAAQQLKSQFKSGDMRDEVDAYAANPNTPELARYASERAKQLEQKDPRMAQLYRSITGIK